MGGKRRERVCVCVVESSNYSPGEAFLTSQIVQDRTSGSVVEAQLLLNSALSDEGALVRMPQVALFIPKFIVHL